ncbi:MAG: hypothetical protein QJR03_10485 [Sphaerobacter sp.]|nr:hypothetical protein [Sphaerobacter sp.]
MGRALLDARRAVDPTIPPPCGEYAATVGRARDDTLPLSERATLLAHAGGCAACRAALAGVARVDDALLAAIDRAAGRLPPLAPAPGARPVGAIVAVALLVALAGAALIAGAGRLPLVGGEARPAAPLVARPAAAPLDGWLLLRTQRGVEALNLASGARVPVSIGDPNVLSAWIVSPSGRHVAYWSPATNALEVSDLTGERVRIWRWPPA